MPTEEAYLRACRANHWRTAQLRANGIEPLRLTDEHPHEPPVGYDFSAHEDSIPVKVLVGFLRNLPMREYHHGHRVLGNKLADAFESGEWRKQ